MAVGLAATPVNMIDGASKTCAMSGEPFRCSVFDIGRVGSYDAPSNVSATADKLQFAVCDTHPAPVTHAASDHCKRVPSGRRCYLAPEPKLAVPTTAVVVCD